MAKTIKRLLAGSLVLVIATVAVPFVGRLDAAGPPASQGSTRTKEIRDFGLRSTAEDLYATVSGMGGETLDTRREAARTLARSVEAEPWLVLLFLSSQAAPTGDEDEQYRQKVRRPFELSVIFAAIEALPEDVSPAVLWALTFLLDEKEEAIWSEDIRVIVTVGYSSCMSNPIREEVRACLTKRMGVDHGFDSSKWRRAIRDGVASKGYRASQPPPWMSHIWNTVIALALVLLGWFAARIKYRRNAPTHERKISK